MDQLVLSSTNPILWDLVFVLDLFFSFGLAFFLSPFLADADLGSGLSKKWTQQIQDENASEREEKETNKWRKKEPNEERKKKKERDWIKKKKGDFIGRDWRRNKREIERKREITKKYHYWYS